MIKTPPDSRKTIMRKMKDQPNQRLTAGHSLFLDGVLMDVQLQAVRCKPASPDVVLDPLVSRRGHQAPDGGWTHVFWFWMVLRLWCSWRLEDLPLWRLQWPRSWTGLSLCSTGSSQLFIKQQCTWTNNAGEGSGLSAANMLLVHRSTLCCRSSRFISPLVERCSPASTWTAASGTRRQMSSLRGRWNDDKTFKRSLRCSRRDCWNNLLLPPSFSPRVIVTCTFALLRSPEPPRVQVFSSCGIAAASEPRKRRERGEGGPDLEGGESGREKRHWLH